MKGFWGRLLRRLGVLLCLGICLWSAAATLGAWAEEKGGEALLFAAGFQVESRGEEEGKGESPGGGAPSQMTLWEEEDPPNHHENDSDSDEKDPAENESTASMPPEDGIVPFHHDELPGIAATPDPQRSFGAVEEIFLEGGEQVGGFHVRDTTGSGTDLAAELKEPAPVSLKGDGRVEVLIYHTHTSEAYSKSAPGFYYTDMETRTKNRDMSVTAVGEELKKALEAKGIGVVHDETVNDELYNGSYSRSWEVIQKNLKKYPGIQVTIDVHRDSMTTQEGVKYKPTVAIKGRKAAQIMLLAGCDFDGGWGDFPDWKENLRLILKVQEKAEALYPGLARPLDFSCCKYNMNATKGSMLAEVGTEVNTVGEARYAGRLLGEVLAETLLDPGA